MMNACRWFLCPMTLSLVLVPLVGGACGDGDEPAAAIAAADHGANATDVEGAGAHDGASVSTDGQGPGERTFPPLPSDPPPVKTYSEKFCPGFIDGLNTFRSSGDNRSLFLRLPAVTDGAPLVFMWHGFGDTPKDFTESMAVADMIAQHGMIVVAPEATLEGAEGLPKTWGLFGDDTKDLTLFDDVLSCLDQEYDIDNHRVYTMGFSAGALWSSLLVIKRSDYLAAAALWSGGTGEAGLVTVDYQTPVNRIPVLLAWGGPSDTYQAGKIDFAAGTAALREQLGVDGHLTVACNHDGGHVVPSGGASWAFDFLMRHHYGKSSDLWGFSGEPYPDYCAFPER